MNEIYLLEKEMLEGGFSYAEIANTTGGLYGSIKNRNHRVYGIDIHQAFLERVKRSGFPNQLDSIDPYFAQWFVGFFDGEGTLELYCGDKRAAAFAVSIELREDDESTIQYIASNIPNSRIYKRPSTENRVGNPSIAWKINKLTTLVEIIIPIFDTYQLKTKKHLEFNLWSEAVKKRYLDTRAGVLRKPLSIEDQGYFLSVSNKIKEIRQH